MNLTQRRYVIAAFWGAYASAVATYLITKRHVQKMADEEIESVKEVYRRKQAESFDKRIEEARKPSSEIEVKEVVDLPESREIVEQMVKQYGSDSQPESLQRPDERLQVQQSQQDDGWVESDDVEAEAAAEVEETHNIFDEPQLVFPDTEGYKDTDRSTVDINKPYVISVDQFNNPEHGYDRVYLTFYEGDDVLADDTDKVVRSINSVIGDESLTKFGDRSGDPEVVYVRNERLEMDYEVTKEPRSFQEVVLKIVSKPKTKLSKFREDDDS